MNLTQATKIAIEIAKTSIEKHRIGAVIFDRSNYVSSPNRCFSVKVLNKSSPYSEHAEEGAINKAIYSKINLKHSTLIVVRINNKNQLMLAYPCRKCQKRISNVGIRNIYFSNDPLRREHIHQNFKSLE